MTLPEIRLVKHFVGIAHEIGFNRDFQVFEATMRAHADAQLYAKMSDKKIERCLRTAYSEIVEQINRQRRR